MMLLAVFFGRYIRKLFKNVQAEVAKSNTIVEETLQGIQIVKTYTSEFFEIERFRKRTRNSSDRNEKRKVQGSFFSFHDFRPVRRYGGSYMERFGFDVFRSD